MKTRFSLRTSLSGLALILAASFATGSSAFAAETPAVVAAYPLTTCVISGDKLEAGDMGPIIEYAHKESGKPDRLVRLCCKGCLKDFKKAPAKYLKIIDDAAAAKAKVAKPATSDGHPGQSQ